MGPADIRWAIDMLRGGKRVTRSGWIRPGQYLELQIHDENSEMAAPYVYIRTAGGCFYFWGPTQDDLLAEDWELVE